MHKNAPPNDTENMIWIMIGILIVIIAVIFLWGKYAGPINTIYSRFKIFESVMFAPLSSWREGVASLLQQDMAQVSFSKITAFFARYQRWLWAPVLLYLAWRVYNTPTFYRTYTPQTLLEKGAEIFPAVVPFVKRNILNEPWNVGPWRLADTPLLFLVRNRLLFDENGYPFLMSNCYMCSESERMYDVQLTNVTEAANGDFAPTPEELETIRKWREGQNGFRDNKLSRVVLSTSILTQEAYENFDRLSLVPLTDSIYLHRDNHLDEARLDRILQAQVGPQLDHANPFNTLKELSDKSPNGSWLFGLAVALYAHGHSPQNKEQGLRLFNIMNNSFAGDVPWERVKIKIGFANTLLAEMNPTEDRQFQEQVSARHGYYLYPFMMSLLAFARKRGVVACSTFAWLRFYDRTLWYSLSQMGGRTAFVEAAGPWSHYYAEEYADDPAGMAPYCDIAIEGIKVEMQVEGWLKPEIS